MVTRCMSKVSSLWYNHSNLVSSVYNFTFQSLARYVDVHYSQACVTPTRIIFFAYFLAFFLTYPKLLHIIDRHTVHRFLFVSCYSHQTLRCSKFCNSFICKKNFTLFLPSVLIPHHSNTTIQSFISDTFSSLKNSLRAIANMECAKTIVEDNNTLNVEAYTV